MSNKTVTIYFPWLSILTVILAVAKATHIIAISWWIVFMPVLLPVIGLSIFFLIVAFIAIIAIIAAALSS